MTYPASGFALIAALSFAALAACGPAPAPPTPNMTEAPATTSAVTPTDAWLGDWTGVEGNTLKIEKGDAPDAYKMSERTLDGPLAYVGTAHGETIVFQDKNGKAMTIHAGTGDDTGLKYLAGKTNCLVIESGRGFCR